MEENRGARLDAFLADRPLALSRSGVQRLIRNGAVTVNDAAVKPGYRVKTGDRVRIFIPPPAPVALEAEAVAFDILYEDAVLIVLNKPAGLVVHPAPGHSTGTLVHGLLYHCNDLSGIGGELRPGVVHRLDKDTSGVMIAAKNDRAHALLAEQFKSGGVRKQYLALVHGRVRADSGAIDLAIARHPRRRKRMAVCPEGGRRALTLWRRAEVFGSGFSLLAVTLKTGRTHQIRVHLAHTGHPVVGDPVYGHGARRWKQQPLYVKGRLPAVSRQMLHSRRMGFIHPDKGEYMEFEAPVPPDMERLLAVLRSLDAPKNGACAGVGAGMSAVRREGPGDTEEIA